MSRKRETLSSEELKKIGLNCYYLRESYSAEHDLTKTISQREFSLLLGISHSAISDIEGGKREMSISELVAYQKICNCSYDHLFGSKTKSPDPDIQGVCERTGLTEKSVEILEKMKGYKVEDAVSYIIEGRKVFSEVKSEMEVPVYSVNFLLKYPGIMGLLYAYLTMDRNDEGSIFIGDRANSILIELVITLRKMREDFSAENEKQKNDFEEKRANMYYDYKKKEGE